jgi:hypothetical protein
MHGLDLRANQGPPHPRQSLAWSGWSRRDRQNVQLELDSTPLNLSQCEACLWGHPRHLQCYRVVSKCCWFSHNHPCQLHKTQVKILYAEKRWSN